MSHTIVAKRNLNSGAPPAFECTVEPTITGTTEVGQTLTCTPGTFVPTPAARTYQWKRDGQNIIGETATTYVTVMGDKDHEISCVVTPRALVDGSPTATTDSVEVTLAYGANWTGRASAAQVQWNKVCYAPGIGAGAGRMVAVADSGTAAQRIMYSDNDGDTWTSATAADASNIQSVCFGNGKFVAVISSPAGTKYVMTSTDGITWALGNMPNGNALYAVAYGAGLFVALAQSGSGNRVSTSPDAITWTAGTCPDAAWENLKWNGSVFVAVASAGAQRTMWSTDGLTWHGVAAAAAIPWQDVAYLPGVGAGAGRWVAVGTAGNASNEFMYSDNEGQSWTSTAAPSDESWNAIEAYDDTLVAVNGTNNGHAVATSLDGIAWTPQVTPAVTGWQSLVRGATKFAAVSNGGNANGTMNSP